MQPYDDSMPRRVFRVGGVTVDEVRPDLRVDGKLQPIDPLARRLLIALLSRPKEVLSKRELYTAGWRRPDAVLDGSLNTAMSSLRGALGRRGHEIVVTVKDVGYTIGLPVETWSAVDVPRLSLGLQADDKVPFRPHWRLDRPLDPASRVWRAIHDSTGEDWVFYFADTVARSVTLRRENEASRDLHRKLGDRDDRVKVIDCEFDHVPHFIARPFVSSSLSELAASGGLKSLGLDALVDLATQVARTVERAHGVGVLHGAIGPGRILIAKTDGGRLRTRLFGFLGEDTMDAPRDMPPPNHLVSDTGGSAEVYLAPEVKVGSPITASSDVYALGVLLLGLITRSLGPSLTPASIADVEEPLLRADIAAATARDADRRLGAADFVKRLEMLPERREAARQQETARRQRERFQRMKLALGVSVVGLVVALGLAAEAWHQRALAVSQRDRAEEITAATEGTVSGLVDDIAHGLGERAGVRLDVLQTLLGRAEGTLGRMISLTPGDSGLRRLQARGLTEFGRTFWEQDDLTRATALGASAASIQRDLLHGRPDDTDLWIDLAESERLLGDVKMRQHDQTEALGAYRSVVEIEHRLAAADPNNEEGRRRLGRAEDLVGDVQMAQGLNKDALATYRAAEADIERPSTPQHNDEAWLVDLAASQQKVGDALDALHEWSEALAFYQKEVVLRRKLFAQDPGNNGYRHDLSLVESSIGDEQDYLKDFVAARASYLEALDLDKELARADPTNETWQRNVAVVYGDIADVADALGDRTGAVAAQESANIRLEAIAAHSPEDVDLQRDLAGTEMNLADSLIKSGNIVAAGPHAARAVRLAKQLARAHPDDPYMTGALQEGLGVAKRAGLSP